MLRSCGNLVRSGRRPALAAWTGAPSSAQKQAETSVAGAARELREGRQSRRSIRSAWHVAFSTSAARQDQPYSEAVNDSSYHDVEANFEAPKRRKRATATGSKKGSRAQQTMKLADLPTHATGPDGKPLAPLEPTARSTVRRRRGKDGAEKATSIEADVEADTEEAGIQHSMSNATEPSSNDGKDHPRINELGPTGQEWPPLAKDVLRNMARFSSCILLTRVGGFYESYFEQAPLLASLLGIKLATRTWGGRPVPMAGFPIVQVEKYLKILVMDHRRLVALCDEFKEIESARTGIDDGGQMSIPVRRSASSRMQAPFAPSINTRLGQAETIRINRRVTRVVSPGTLIDEAFLDPFASNWILSISNVAGAYGIAWLDVSTADFYTTVCTDEQSLRDEVARIGPSEIVLERGTFTRALPQQDGLADSSASIGVTRDFGRSAPFLPDDSSLWEAVDPSNVHVSFIEPAPAISGAGVTDAMAQAESMAVANLTRHLRDRLLEIDIHGMEDLTGTGEGPNRRRRDRVLTMDASTLSALEINASMRRDEQSFNPLSTTLSVRGSLLSTVRRTVTKGGARLLAQWLTAPSTALPVIQRRQALVALFVEQSALLTEDLRSVLRRRAGDINRALQRIITSRNDEQDLLEVRDFAALSTDLVTQLKAEIGQSRKGGLVKPSSEDGWQALEAVINAVEDLSSLGQRLGDAIDEGVIARRLRMQEDRERELEATILGEEGRIASGDEDRTRIARKAWKASDDDADEGSAKLWGQAFEHLIYPGASSQLTALTREHTLLRRRALRLEEDLRSRFSERISLRFLLGQGYVVHLSDVREGMQKTLAEMDKEMSMAYKSKTTRTFYHEQFTKIGSRLGRVELELQEKEAIELQRLRLDVLVESGRIRRNASMIHELDVLSGFAALARELNLVRPNVHEGTGLQIKDGRHIGVELALLHQQRQSALQLGNLVPADFALSRRFTPNDVSIGDDSKLHLITGPNMGGKSTLLRMVAIIAILAQTGSFVPASSCSIGIIDQIFSRIGAHDAIHADKSTFMVEMLEVGQLLRRSTEHSLVLCDEVGRGTDHLTGISIAHATAMHLVNDIGCKCLFATHLHDVGDMLRDTRGVAFYCTDLEETPEHDVVFSHKLRPGLNRKSHGLAIARLAGLPDEVLAQADHTLQQLQIKDAQSRTT